MDKMEQMIQSLAQRLYEMFWRRNGQPAPEPFADQAPAIRNMWLSIAADCLTLLMADSKALLDKVDPDLFANLTRLALTPDADALKAEFAKIEATV